MKPTLFSRLSGTLLIMSARVTCRACFVAGKRGPDTWVIDPKLARRYGGLNSGTWRTAIVKAARKHYTTQHPNVPFPRTAPSRDAAVIAEGLALFDRIKRNTEAMRRFGEYD